MSTLKQRFARLKELRPDVSQADLARATGAKPPSVNAWFTGETKSMKGATAAKAAALYGVNPLWLAEGVGEMLSSGGAMTIPMPQIVAGDVPANTTVMHAMVALGRVLADLDSLDRENASNILRHLALEPHSAEKLAIKLEALLGGAGDSAPMFSRKVG